MVTARTLLFAICAAHIFRTITMPGNAKNPENPYAPAVDALSDFNLQLILEYIEHRGGPSRIASLSIGKIPGLLPVIYYIDHEHGINNRPTDVFDFFELDPTQMRAGMSEDVQELIYVVDDSEGGPHAENQELPGYTAQEPPAVKESPAGDHAQQALTAPVQFTTAAAGATHEAGQMPAYLDEEDTGPGLLLSPAPSTWSMLPSFFACGALIGPQGLFSLLLGSDTHPFSM